MNLESTDLVRTLKTYQRLRIAQAIVWSLWCALMGAVIVTAIKVL